MILLLQCTVASLCLIFYYLDSKFYIRKGGIICTTICLFFLLVGLGKHYWLNLPQYKSEDGS